MQATVNRTLTTTNLHDIFGNIAPLEDIIKDDDTTYLESTEETVEEVADKDAEQEHLDRQKEEEESIALDSEKAKEKAKRAKTKKTRDAGKPSSGGRFLGGLALVAVSALVADLATIFFFKSLLQSCTQNTLLCLATTFK